MQSHKIMSRRLWLLPLLIFLAAFIVRLVYLNQVESMPTFNHPIMDEQYHVSLAEQINSEEGLPDEPFYRAPLYPYFLAFVFRMTSESFYWTRFLQIILGSFLPLLLFALALKLFDRKVALWTAAVAVLYPTLIYYDSALLITSLMVLLTTLLVWQLYRCQSKPVPWQFILAGVLLGLAGLARPNILMLGPFLFVWIAIVIKPLVGWKKAILNYALIAIASLVIIMPVTVRNYVVGQDLVFIAWQGGFNFFVGNNRAASGWSATIPGVDITWEGGYKQAINMAEIAEGRRLKRSEVSDFWYGQALKEITERPADYFALQLRKLRLTFNGYELPNNQSIYLAREFAPIVKPFLFESFVFFPYGLLAPLALLGIAFSLSQWRKYLILYLALGSYIVTFLLFFVCARFRQPLLPILIIFAVSAVYQFMKLIKKRDLKNLSLAALVLILLLLESNHDLTGLDRNRVRAENHFLLGSSLLEQGNLAGAQGEFRKSIVFDSSYARSYNNLALIAIRRGDPNSAAQNFLNAIRLEPNTLEPYFNYATMHIERKQFERALEILYEARERRPLNDFVHLKIGMTLYQTGKINEARSAIEESLRLNPDSDAARQVYQQLLLEIQEQ